MKYNFLQENITPNEIKESAKGSVSSILLENNQTQIEKILDFFNSNNSILLATGFLGTGKTEVIKHCLEALNPESVTLWANCYESTNLDDIFLGFFEEFKQLSMQGKIKIPQAKFENFSQRINAYFYSISRPIVIVINSYQALLQENAEIILEFIKSLSEFSKIKTIIISRNLKIEEALEKTKYEKIAFKALSTDLVRKLLTSAKIRIHGPVFDEFYKFTKGYYFYTILAIRIIVTHNISPIDLMAQHAKSFLTMKEFLFREFLSMVDAPSAHLLRFLTVIRYPVNIKLLQTLNLYNEVQLQNLADNFLIEIEHGNIYLKDYYKDITEGEIPNNILIKLHRSCVELYEMQLPRKPEERDLLISRRTIRQEIEYHKLFLPKKVELTNSIEVFNGQAMLFQQSQQPKTKIDPKIEEIAQNAALEQSTKLQQETPKKPKELKDLLFVFDENEENILLNDIANSLNDFMKDLKREELLEANLNTNSLLNLISEVEKEYDYKRVISLCNKLLSKDNLSQAIIAQANFKMANAYANQTDIYNALKRFQTAKEIYIQIQDDENQKSCQYNIAKMYYRMFKRKEAKELLQNLSEAQNQTLNIERNLLLFDIFMDNDDEINAFEICKKTLKMLDDTQNPTIISELYFKCGLILEIRGNYEKAIEAYNRAVNFNSDSNVNKFLLNIYSNLTNLYEETDDIKNAIKFANKTLQLNKKQQNFEELCKVHLKLAQLGEKEQENLEQAMKYAKLTSDNFYISSSLIAYGDFLYSKVEIVEALKKYLTAYQIIKKNFVQENLHIIKNRILDVKYRLPEELFKKEAKEFNYEE